MKIETYLQPHPKSFAAKHMTASIIKLPLHPPHRHTNFEIAFVIKGNATHVINDVRFNWTKNRCAIIRPSDSHYFQDTTNNVPFSYEHKDVYVFNDRFKQICDAMSPELFKKITDYPQPIEFFISNECIYSILNKIDVLRTTSDVTLQNSIYTVIVSTIISQWLIDEASVHKNLPEWISDLMTDLNKLEILSLSVSDIAKRVGYSPPYFSRTFKMYTGKTFINYLTQKRMHFSLDLLKSGINIIDISQALGYSNPSTFCKHFHKEFGSPPNKYRQKTQK